jgi:hypothetical protein
MTREEILTEIRRTAEENGGKPLGRDRFLRVTGITEYELGRHWARYGDAVREAGFEPNKLTAAYDDGFLIEKFIGLTRRLGCVPTRSEMRLERIAADPSFPDSKVYERFGSKNQLIAKTLEYGRARTEHADVVPILESAFQRAPAVSLQTGRSAEDGTKYGFVYLVRGHPGEYKIGRTTSSIDAYLNSERPHPSSRPSSTKSRLMIRLALRRTGTLGSPTSECAESGFA